MQRGWDGMGWGNSRERMFGTTTTKDSKGENEDTNLGTSVQGGRDNVIVFVEELGMVATEPELGGEPEQEVREDGGVDADE